MPTWDPSLTSQDIELVIEMIDEWEDDGPADKLRMIRFLKEVNGDISRIMEKAPDDMPQEIRDMFEEYFEKMKKDLLPNEKKFKLEMKIRQERAVFMKAKFYLLQQEKAASEAFDSAIDDAVDSDDESDEPVKNDKPRLEAD